MYHLKLCKGLSYYGMDGVLKATRQQPDVHTEDKATADAAVASGFFKLVEAREIPDFPPIGETTGHLDPEQFESMTIPDLKKLAEKMGVDIKGCKDKAAIIAALAAVEVIPPSFDPEELAELDLEGLTAYAAENGISLEGIPATREDVLEAICVANGGSYTMLDLMRE